jgi:Protein of unknown function (DUF2783)
MHGLKTLPNLSKPDDVYDILIKAHEGLSKAQSDALNARLILIAEGKDLHSMIP